MSAANLMILSFLMIVISAAALVLGQPVEDHVVYPLLGLLHLSASTFGGAFVAVLNN